MVHQLHRWPGRVCQYRLRLGAVDKGAENLWLVCHIIDGNAWQVGAAAVLIRPEYESRTTASGLAGRIIISELAIGWRDRGGDTSRVVPEASECLGKVIGVYHLIGRILETHLPSLRGRRRRRDEKELAGVRQLEVVLLLFDWCRGAKVDSASLTQNRLTIPDLAHCYCGLLIEERDNYAPEGFQRSPRVNGGY